MVSLTHTHTLILFRRTRHQTKVALQAEFDMGVLTTYLPVTFDKLRSMADKDAHLTISDEINLVSLAGPQTSSPAPPLVIA